MNADVKFPEKGTKKLGFGTMRLPLTDPKDPESIDLEQYKKMVDAFIDAGFVHFDTAYFYHNGASERALKAALTDRYPRSSYTVTSKFPPGVAKTPEDRDRVFEDQLAKTGLEYFDYYWLHCITKQNYESYFEAMDCFTWLAGLKERGLVRHTGISFHADAAMLEDILNRHPEIEYVQLQINYLDWDSSDIQSRLCYDTCIRHGKRIMVMEPLRGGVLAKVPSEAEALFKKARPELAVPGWALSFAASLEGVDLVLSGMSDLQQMEDNLASMKAFTPLTEPELELCRRTADMINEIKAIGCTGCRYCTEGCPQGIDIPRFFAMYNRLRHTTSAGTIGRLKQDYRDLVREIPGPGSCIGCRQCEGACPQHLEISSLLKEIDEEMCRVSNPPGPSSKSK